MSGSRFLPMLLTTVVALSSCSVSGTGDEDGSGDVVERAFEVDDFVSIDVASAFEASVVIDPDSTHQVIVEIDDNLIDEVDVDTDGDRLVVRIRSGARIDPTVMRVSVRAPVLTGIEASGASEVEADGALTGDVEIRVSGASSLDASIDADEVTIDASGASEVDLTGRANELDLDASGASDVGLAELSIEEAAVDASGASRVSLRVTGRVTGEASGASSVEVRGGGQVSIGTSGASSVETR